jgi:streptogramin lyase
MTHRRHTWSAGWLFALLLPALAIPPNAASSRPFVQVTRVTPRFAVAIPHVTRVRAANRGKIAEYTVPSPHCGPAGMTAGPDGQLWFVENLGNRLGEFDASTGTFTEYAIPSRNSSPVRITADAYGNVWFTEANANKIGEFTIATPHVCGVRRPHRQQQPVRHHDERRRHLVYRAERQ